MARISTYDFDGTLSNTDKIIGTDSSDTATKNFKLQDLKEFIFSGISGPVTINSSGVSSVTFPDVTLGSGTSGSYVESLVAGDGIQILNNSGESATPTIKVNPLQTTITSILNTGLCVGRDSDNKICFTTDNQIRFTVDNTLELILKSTALMPETDGGLSLGEAGTAFSNLFLDSLAVIGFGNGNMSLTHSSAALTVSTTDKLQFHSSKGSIHASADGQLDIDADDEVEINSAKIDIDATGNGSDAIVIEATAGGVDILASGAAAGEDIDITATGSSVNITSTESDASAIHLNASAGGINIDASSGDIDIDSSTVDMLTTSTMVLLSQSTTSLKGNTGATFGDDTEQIVFDGSGNVNFDAVTLDIDASSTMTLDGTGVSIDGTLDSNFTVTGSGKDLTLSVAGGGTQQLILNSEGTGSTNAIVINSSAGGLDIDAAAGASIDAVGIAINSGSGELDLTTTGTLDVNANALDMDLTDSSSITLTSSEAGEDLTISQVGGNDSSIIINAAGTGTDAIKLNASAGSIDIDSADNITVDAADNITLQSTSSDGVVSLISAVDTDSGQRGILIQANGDPSVKTDIDAGHLDITATLASIDAAQVNLGVQAGCAVDIGHTSSITTVLDDFTVNGTFKINTSSNQITFPTSRGNNNQVLKTDGSGNLSFTDPSSGITVADTSSSSHLPIVLQDGANNLLDDEDALTFQPATGLLKVNNLSPQSNDGGSLGATGSSYSDLFLANGGVIEFKAGTGNRSQITHIDGSSGDEGSLRLNAKTKLEFNDAQVSIASLDDGHLDLAADTEVQVVSPIVNIDASTRVDISGALTVGGALTLPSQTTKTFFAAPSGSDGAPSFRTIAVADVPTLNQNTTGSAATLTTARDIGGVSFDGSSNIDLPGVNASGNQDTSGTAAKVTVTDYSSGVLSIVLHNDANQLFDDTDHFQFKQTNSTIASVTDTQFTLTLGETTDYAHYFHGGNIDFKSGATISSHDAGFYIMGNAYYKLVSGSGGFVKKIAAPSEVLKLRDQELTLSVHTSNGDTSSKMTLTEVFSVTAAGNLTVTGELDGASLDISGNADIDGTLETDALSINGTTVSSTAAELNYNDTGASVGTVVASKVVTVDSNKDVSSFRNVTASGNYTGANFVVSSDKRLKSEIEPIKEGLEVIKQFTSYNYIKGGEKESGFIAQEVREAIPHTVYENNEGYLSMSDRGVLAHIHKAILEIDKRLKVIEEKIK